MSQRDSPRWCDECQAWGDHHTDRHPVSCDGGGVLYETLTPKLDRRDPAYTVREWPCPGCSNCEDPMAREGVIP